MWSIRFILSARTLWLISVRQANLANTVILPEYVTVDAMGWARIGKVKAQLNIRNIFDRDYIVSGHGTVGNLNIPGLPRSAMLTLRYEIQ